ncbi:MAG: hypothetical protein SAK42_08560, partial [Oscillatoria sp. PMC 1076.18]|nr:hypothetical protein [Oscillatoria sp. PMC 1076.18]
KYREDYRNELAKEAGKTAVRVVITIMLKAVIPAAIGLFAGGPPGAGIALIIAYKLKAVSMSTIFGFIFDKLAAVILAVVGVVVKD